MTTNTDEQIHETAARAIAAGPQRVEASVLREITKISSQAGMISLAGGMPATDLFDIEGLHTAMNDAMQESADRALKYGVTSGDPELQQMIALLMEEREATVEAKSILVTTGASQGIDLIGRVLLNPGDVIIVEKPTFLATLNMAQLCGAEVAEVEIDSEGIVIESLEALLGRLRRVKALYTMPSFSNPSGRVLAEARRLRLLELAREHNVVVVEDDPYGELWFDQRPPPSLLSLAGRFDGDLACVHLNSFSKIMAPGLRLGWMIAPPPILERAEVVKQIADVHTSALDQTIALKYLESGRLQARLNVARASYGERARWLSEALRDDLGDLVEFTPPTGGMFLWCRLKHHLADPLAKEARQKNVAVIPGDPFFASPPRDQYLRLSYSMVTEESAAKAVARLAEAMATPHSHGSCS
ncbi:MAG: PLP-dependent aminotransferase family protein [Solirubrobacterales bacterium]